MLLHLPPAFSNRARRGGRHDFKDAERLVRWLLADELILSFVPNGEQRIGRNLTRMKMQLTRDRIRLQSQMECLLEEMRIKLSSVVTDLLGVSGLRILRPLAAGETEAKRSAALGDNRLKCTEEQLLNALTGSSQPMHREMLALQLEEVPGRGVDSAQQIIAQVGSQAGTFPSAAELTSWVGTCPGKDERRAEPQ
jgi:transposase